MRGTAKHAHDVDAGVLEGKDFVPKLGETGVVWWVLVEREGRRVRIDVDGGEDQMGERRGLLAGQEREQRDGFFQMMVRLLIEHYPGTATGRWGGKSRRDRSHGRQSLTDKAEKLMRRGNSCRPQWT